MKTHLFYNLRMFFNELSEEIFSRYGNIKRQRGHFLYTEKGKRLCDLYREDGRAFLGYRETSAWTMFKNALGRGVTGSYRTSENYRLGKAVSELLDSERTLYIFNDLEKALLFSAAFSTDSFAVYKPWNWEGIESYSGKKIVLFEPVLSWPEGIFILAVEKSLAENSAENIKKVNVTETILNAPMIAGISRSVYDLIGAIQNLSEKDFFKYDKFLTKYWTRKGPWLFPKVEKSEYDSFVLKCLDAALVVNPNYDRPSIVPFGIDKGSFKNLNF